MKKLESLIVVASVLMLLGLVVQYSAKPLSLFLVNQGGLEMNQAMAVMFAVQGFVSLLIRLVIAGWIYREAQQGGESPWLWVLLALTFQFLAPILLFAWRLHRVHTRQSEPAGTPS
ncbi:MAG TPA: hypothetical protein PKC67_04205 [Kiritimatiellia bacterium]|nr:hypothetical protein [Kiritimatiellia bacterium]HMP33531.1 hypothetical protein [Kiritimatiellia bacterium]